MQNFAVEITPDYPTRVRAVRARLELTQTRLAAQIGVSFATINRWENGQAKPTRLAWRQILDLEADAVPRHRNGAAADTITATSPALDFAGDPAAVAAVAEAKRLAYGHLFNG